MSDLNSVLLRLEKDLIALSKDRELIEYKLEDVVKKFEMLFEVVKTIEQKLVNTTQYEMRTDKLENATQLAEQRVLDIIQRLNKVELTIKEFETNLNAKEIVRHIELVQNIIERIKAIEQEQVKRLEKTQSDLENNIKTTDDRKHNITVGFFMLIVGGAITFVAEKLLGG
jgi:uncharacterized ion transporter superfamily protein YfcC